MEHSVGQMVLYEQDGWGDNGSLDVALFGCKGDVGYGFCTFGVKRVILGKVVDLPLVGSASRGEEMQETLKDVGGKFYI